MNNSKGAGRLIKTKLKKGVKEIMVDFKLTKVVVYGGRYFQGIRPKYTAQGKNELGDSLVKKLKEKQIGVTYYFESGDGRKIKTSGRIDDIPAEMLSEAVMDTINGQTNLEKITEIINSHPQIMARMTTPPEDSSRLIKELACRMIGQALQNSYGAATSAALINVGEIEKAGVDQETLANKIKEDGLKLSFHPTNYQIISVEQILNGQTDLAPSCNALIITGYASNLINKGNKIEEKVQSFPRAMVNTGKAQKLIILSSTLPSTVVFNAALPWYNGPFGEKSIWSVKISEGGLSLVQHTLTRGFARENEWMDLKTIPYSFPVE